MTVTERGVKSASSPDVRLSSTVLSGIARPLVGELRAVLETAQPRDDGWLAAPDRIIGGPLPVAFVESVMPELPDFLPIHRALFSVSNKNGIAELGRTLAERGVEILSTGGTARALAAAGIPVREVADETSFPEILGGRVKTLHPKIHGGILGRRDVASDRAEMTAAGIAPIDLVVVNLYPFEAAVARSAAPSECIETIDIGGPAMLRAAAKNHAFVAALAETSEYAEFLTEFRASGGTSAALRRRLAATAFQLSAAYDAAIGRWLAERTGNEFPERFTLTGRRATLLRYGENPHQAAALYRIGAQSGIASARQVQGKELSYNNINDTDAAYACVAEFEAPCVAIVKHANPCGVATGSHLAAAWDLAFRSDPVSAFGGVVAVNRPLDQATAEKIAAIFVEVVIAPDASEEARDVLARKKNLRLLLGVPVPDSAAPGLAVRTIAGGFLVQERDHGRIAAADFKVMTKRAPTAAERADLLFAFRVVKHVRSNAIVYATGAATVGIGAGQMSRVDAARMGAWKAEQAARAVKIASLTNGAVAASDAFFPFPDGLETIAETGVTAVIQPGGSIRDKEVIAAADRAGIAMVFTGMRHFRH